MKITKEYLVKVIKEELGEAIRETPEEKTPEEKAQEDYDRMKELEKEFHQPKSKSETPEEKEKRKAKADEYHKFIDKFKIIRNVASTNDRIYGRSQRGYKHLPTGVVFKGSLSGGGSLGS